MKRFRDTEYLVSEDGRVWSEKTQKFLSPSKERGGYLKVTISNKGKSFPFRLHRIVAEVFIENPNNYSQVNHIDNDVTDNNVNNLEWCSPLMNSQHTSRQKRQAIGIKSGRHKLNKQQILEIKELIATNELTNLKIAKLYNISESYVSAIKLNKTRKHLNEEIA